MTLTQQFLIVSIFPLSFLGMLAYLLHSGREQRQTTRRWTLALVAAAIWASSVLRYYGGVTIPDTLVVYWGVVGDYALSITAVGILLTTIDRVPMNHGQQIPTVFLPLALTALAIGADPRIWSYDIPNVVLANQTITHFDLWAAVWITSWWIASVAAFALTQQLNVRAPLSLYRNQINYWLLALVLFLFGGSLASIHQPDQPFWQELGLLLIIPAAWVGTISIVRRKLPDLKTAVRQILSRLSGTLIIFGLTWAVLSFLTQRLANLPPGTSHNLVLVLAALLFAGLFMVVYRLVNDLTKRIFLPSPARQAAVTADYSNMAGNLPEPAQIGHMALRMVESNLTTEDGWCFLAEDGPGGRLMLRPLATLNDGPESNKLETAAFAPDSPFTQYLRDNTTPLTQFDIDNAPAFTPMAKGEHERLAYWNRVLYVPLRAGDSLIGVLALGSKQIGELYDQRDLAWLQSLAGQISPMLVQASHLASLQQINNYVFTQNQDLGRQKQHLEALISLQNQFIMQISPELRRPFLDLDKQLATLQSNLDESEWSQLETANQHLQNARIPIDTLIKAAGRIQSHRNFNFQLLQIDSVIRHAVRDLRPMAEKRQLRIEVDVNKPVPPIYGDEQQLRNALYYLLHNAIKFNKIGGAIHIECATKVTELCLSITDTGVGIPKERLETIWRGFDRVNGNGNRNDGMGLVLTQFIVNAHGGRVSATSKYGSGSTFSIYLPLAFSEQE